MIEVFLTRFTIQLKNSKKTFNCFNNEMLIKLRTSLLIYQMIIKNLIISESALYKGQDISFLINIVNLYSIVKRFLQQTTNKINVIF